MNQLSAAQVQATFDTAGVKSLERPAVLAASLSKTLAAVATAFGALPFDAEPASFIVALRKEQR